jgi:hypothetical protein
VGVIAAAHRLTRQLKSFQRRSRGVSNVKASPCAAEVTVLIPTAVTVHLIFRIKSTSFD